MPSSLIQEIEYQNAFAVAMLDYASTDLAIKKSIGEIGKAFVNNILDKIIDEVESQVSIEAVSLFIKEFLTYLVGQHSSKNSQHATLRSDISFEDLNTTREMRRLLTDIRHMLIQVDKIDSILKLQQYYKCLSCIGSGYFLYLKPWHTPDLPMLTNLIYYSPPEITSRIFRHEIEENQACYARSFGLFTRKSDLIEKNKIQNPSPDYAREAGKAVYICNSTAVRYTLILSHYLKAKNTYALLSTKNLVELNGVPPEELQQAMKMLNDWSAKMHDAGIPLDEEERKNQGMENIIEAHTGWFEKFAKLSGSPAISGFSGHTAGVFLCLLDLKFFKNEDNTVNIDSFQIFSNVWAAYLIHGGHHCLLETAEACNRALESHYLIDYYMAREPLTLDEEATYKLPYYTNNLSTFLHGAYAEKILHQIMVNLQENTYSDDPIDTPESVLQII